MVVLTIINWYVVSGLFYYGGHGSQSDERLMLPIDAPKDYGIEHCLSEKEVKNMMLCRNPSLRVIILDMCLRAPDRYKIVQKKKTPNSIYWWFYKQIWCSTVFSNCQECGWPFFLFMYTVYTLGKNKWSERPPWIF